MLAVASYLTEQFKSGFNLLLKLLARKARERISQSVKLAPLFYVLTECLAPF